MQIKIVNEAGLESALIGMKFSFQEECDIDDIETILKYPMSTCVDMEDYKKKDLYSKYMNTAKKLCCRDKGHNKFLEQIQVWMILRAPLYFWKQFDTYRVGTSKLSKSTMHSLMRKELVDSDFEQEGLQCKYSDCGVLSLLNNLRVDKEFDELNKLLPQSFLQTRMVNTNYKVLRNMCIQRKGHKLTEWEYFIDEVQKQLNNPELLGLEV